MWLGRPRAGASGSPARGSARAQCLDTGRPVLCTSEGSSETGLAPYARAVFARAWLNPRPAPRQWRFAKRSESSPVRFEDRAPRARLDEAGPVVRVGAA